ncbi:MAG: alkaline phosphatase family protein, partial [Candidatus Wallbacteria bacterium]|nr:alkaline phosphatase family protein [Candidatus Wallbacteria bacterium]
TKLRQARPDARLLLVSDHGFAPFYWSVNLNRWLLDNGYLALATEGEGGGDRVLADLFKGRNLWSAVDWRRTRAYSVGLGLIYLNLMGREPAGVVEPGARAEALEGELAQRLVWVRHPGNGQHAIRSVTLGRLAYRGPCLDDAPDLVVNFSPGFRVSWQSALGGIDEPIVAENKRAWSADHCSVAPEAVPGVVMGNLPLDTARASIMDVAPTILTLQGVPVPNEMEGRSLYRK